MTAEQLQILQHALGVDEFGQGEQYRNHFCSGVDDLSTCEGLVLLGYMERYPDRAYIPYPTFGVTATGKKAMSAESPALPRLTRSQKRYRAFLDADCGLSFREWISYYKEAAQ